MIPVIAVAAMAAAVVSDTATHRGRSPRIRIKDGNRNVFEGTIKLLRKQVSEGTGDFDSSIRFDDEVKFISDWADRVGEGSGLTIHRLHITRLPSR